MIESVRFRYFSRLHKHKQTDLSARHTMTAENLIKNTVRQPIIAAALGHFEMKQVDQGVGGRNVRGGQRRFGVQRDISTLKSSSIEDMQVGCFAG